MLLNWKHVLLLLICGTHVVSEMSTINVREGGPSRKKVKRESISDDREEGPSRQKVKREKISDDRKEGPSRQKVKKESIPDDHEDGPRPLYEKEFFNRIVGGKEVKKNTYPWFARSVYKGSSSWGGCGGSLITPEFVLTAAHCPTNKSDYGYQIAALCPEKDDNCGQKYLEYFDIEEEIPHPNYDEISNDVKLVHLKGKSKNTPINIDFQNIAADYTGNEPLWVIGFGDLETGGSPSDELRHVKIKYVTDEQCNSIYGELVDENDICAADDGKDSCQGDSGGPLYDKKADKLVGVVSWGIGCADARYPSVYTQIGSHIPWILDTICLRHGNPKPFFCEGYTSFPTTSLAPSIVPTTTPGPTSEPTPYDCDGKDFEFVIKFGNFPEEISWKVEDLCNDNAQVAESANYTTATVSTKVSVKKCLTQDTKFLFTIEDNFGDGIISGCDDSSCGYKIFYDDKEVGEMSQGFESIETHEFGLAICSTVSPAPTAGPSTPVPTSFPTTTVPTSKPTQYDCDEKEFEIEINFDNFPWEISWKVEDLCNGNRQIAESADYTSVALWSKLSVKKCLTQDTKFLFTIEDECDDGIRGCTDTNCGYKIFYDNMEVGNMSQDFNSLETHEFGSAICSTVSPVPTAGPTTTPGPTSEPTPYDCNGKVLDIVINFDEYPEEIFWKVEDLCNDNRQIAESANYTTVAGGSKLSVKKCFTQDTKFLFTIEDEYGDGFDCNDSNCGYKIFYDDEMVGKMSQDFESKETHEFDLTNCPTVSPAPTSDPTTSGPTSVPTPYDCDGKGFEFEILFDPFPFEISWKVEDLCNGNTQVAESTDYSFAIPRTKLNVKECFTQDTKFLFTIEDEYEDGLMKECADSNCGYKIFYDDEMVGEMSQDFKSLETHTFGLARCPQQCKDRTNVGNTCRSLPRNLFKLRKECIKPKKKGYVYDYCPDSCKLCGYDCKDNKNKFKWKKNKAKRYCNTLPKIRCNQPTVAINCPKKCNKCG